MNNYTNRRATKLALQPETVRSLRPVQLEAVVGGSALLTMPPASPVTKGCS